MPQPLGLGWAGARGNPGPVAPPPAELICVSSPEPLRLWAGWDQSFSPASLQCVGESQQSQQSRREASPPHTSCRVRRRLRPAGSPGGGVWFSCGRWDSTVSTMTLLGSEHSILIRSKFRSGKVCHVTPPGSPVCATPRGHVAWSLCRYCDVHGRHSPVSGRCVTRYRHVTP